MDVDKKTQFERARVLSSPMAFDESRYEFDDSFRPADITNPFEVHTTAEMLACLEHDKKVELDAKVIGVNPGTRKRSIKTLERDSFLTAFKEGSHRFREGVDVFATDQDQSIMGTGAVGDDFLPFLGGPFYKNLYFYQDYIRMHSACFFAYHHDPFAKAIVNITRDFTLGRGYRVDADEKNPKSRLALALWRSFEEANDLQETISQLAHEISIYGESMIWKLPNQQTKIVYRLGPDDPVPQGLIPRVRIIDPSNIVEIVTYPEDISRKLFYVWLAPTQYQIYTGTSSSDQSGQKVQPVLKFIYRQIPADQMLHYRINGVSNEKRGRSDLYPILGYLKRLRDSVNYGVISTQKQSAWSIDTSIDGSQDDINTYADAQAALGTITGAGSEFIHSTKIKREYLSPAAGGRGGNPIFEWLLSEIAAGAQIPVSYFGTHLSGGQTRASAIVATEPVAKKFEMRQLIYERILRDLWNYNCECFGLGRVECEITFPEIITQDRSAKLKDLALAEMQHWISNRHAATIAAKEFGITNYDYDQEQAALKADPPVTPQASSPLTAAPGASQKGSEEESGSTSAITSEEKRNINQNYGA